MDGVHYVVSAMVYGAATRRTKRVAVRFASRVVIGYSIDHPAGMYSV